MAGYQRLRLAIYLAIASLGTAGALVLPNIAPYSFEEVAATAAYMFLAGGVLGIPGTIPWLLFVAAMPPEWPVRHRRAFAVIASPSIQIVWLGLFLSEQAHALAAIFGLLLPAGSAFVVRLRERRPSSPFPPE